MKSWLQFIFNTSLFAFLFAAFAIGFTFLFIGFLNIIKPMGSFDLEIWVLYLMGAWVLFIVILVLVHMYETRHWKGHTNRFSRFYKTSGSLRSKFDLKEILRSLENFGFININNFDKDGIETIDAFLKAGIYDFPLRAGGHKKYDAKSLRICINPQLNYFEILITTRSNWLPTAFAYSNIYIGEHFRSQLKSPL